MFTLNCPSINHPSLTIYLSIYLSSLLISNCPFMYLSTSLFVCLFIFVHDYLFSFVHIYLGQSAGAVEYTDCTSAKE